MDADADFIEQHMILKVCDFATKLHRLVESFINEESNVISFGYIQKLKLKMAQTAKHL